MQHKNIQGFFQTAHSLSCFLRKFYEEFYNLHFESSIFPHLLFSCRIPTWLVRIVYSVLGYEGLTVVACCRTSTRATRSEGMVAGAAAEARIVTAAPTRNTSPTKTGMKLTHCGIVSKSWLSPLYDRRESYSPSGENHLVLLDIGKFSDEI